MRDSVIRSDRLLGAARQFEAFQLLRLIECAHPHRARLGAAMRPAQEPLRLGQDPDLRFTTAQVASYEGAVGVSPARLALDFGLLGPEGPMPLHVTEYVRARSRHHGDRAFERFLDLFHHRMSSLRFRAFAAGQPVIGLDRCDDDRFAGYVRSLCGLASGGEPSADRIDDAARRSVAALLGDRRRHAAGLAALLAHETAAPVEIVPFAGQWLPVPDDAGIRFGARSGGSLRTGYVLGRRIWDRQHRFRVRIGPLDAMQSERLQPGGAGYDRLTAWVRLYVGATLDFDIELRLTHDAAPAMRLGTDSRLARSTWLGSTKRARAKPVLRLCASPRSSLNN